LLFCEPNLRHPQCSALTTAAHTAAQGDGGTEAEAEVQVAYTVPVSTAKGALTPAR
jgi:hypothetical protein